MKKFSLLITLIISFLFIPKVDAISQEGWGNYVDLTVPAQVYLYNCSATDCSTGKSYEVENYYYTSLNNGNSLSLPMFPAMTFGLHGGVLAFTTQTYDPKILYRMSVYFCANNTNFSDNNLNYDLFVAGQNINLSRSNQNLTNYYYIGSSMNTQPFTDANSWAYCASREYLFAPTINGRYFNISITRKGSTNYSGAITFLGYDMEPLGSIDGLTASDVQSIVSNSGFASAESVEEVQASVNEVKEELADVGDSVDKVNDSITDDSVKDDTGSSFFDDFEISDNGGLSQIITAPLVAINKMLDGTCTPLTATWRGKDVSLPCGYSFWESMPDVQKFLNVVLGGFLCYGILRKLYLLIDGLKNPEDDRVEVMKL